MFIGLCNLVSFIYNVYRFVCNFKFTHFFHSNISNFPICSNFSGIYVFVPFDQLQPVKKQFITKNTLMLMFKHTNFVSVFLLLICYVFEELYGWFKDEPYKKE